MCCTSENAGVFLVTLHLLVALKSLHCDNEEKIPMKFLRLNLVAIEKDAT